MDRLTALDASFLEQERNGAHLHVGAVLICDGPAPPPAQLAEHLTSRLERVPRYRQRLARPALGIGKPYWVDDPAFDLDHHVRYTTLARRGGEDELRRLAGRIFSQRLDRSKPLWELWVVEGLAGGGFALINKTHHAVVDGVSGVDVTTALFDAEPDVRRETAEPWTPSAPPTPLGLAARTTRDAAVTPLRFARNAIAAASTPADTLRGAARALAGLGEVAGVVATGSPNTPVNGPIGPHRDLCWLEFDLQELKDVKNALDGTVNDVFLAVIAGALGRWLCERGHDPASLALRGCVPVSVRAESERGALGNRIVAMFAPLPIREEEPVRRLRLVSEAMQALKASGQAAGADAIGAIQELAPPAILAHASRLQFSSRLYNLVLSNVPGPQRPVWVLGRELRSFIPVAFLAEDKRIAVAIVTYNGRACISVLADGDHVTDLDDLMEAIEAARVELLAAATAFRSGLHPPAHSPDRATHGRSR